jgi:D-glycero-D-manno-heptose 1,7-bisphosphate phosphatase
MKKKAIFLDRDGVINIEKEYLYKIEDFEFVDGVFSSLKYLQKKDFLLFVITNQSGIRRGYYSYYDFSILNSWMIDEFFKKGVKISQVEFCPHIPQDNCLCRKPKIQMIQNILENYDIDLEKSWLIGDKHSDILCAKNANIKNTIQVQSGHKFDKNKSLASYIVSSIKDIQNIIV